jgi:isopentenyl-diphosphate delta-isomerase
MDIESRKKDHVEAAKKKAVEYSFSAGFEDVRFIHQSLPEMDFEEIACSAKLFGKEVSAPIIISGMTGGYPEAEKINLRLAKAAEEERVAMGLGSQRAMLEKPQLAYTFKVRKAAPTIPLIGNIGGCQLEKYGVEKVRRMLDEVGADALAIHLNPLQEVVQPEGDSKFSGVLQQIGIFARDLGLPVIVKETGAGISSDAAASLKKAGVSMIDVSGAGGTSWSKVEYLRSKEAPTYADWGNPTAECIAACSGILPIIASGGLRSGLDAAKAIALGADFAAAALPFLRSSNPQAEISKWKHELRIAMLLTGSKNLEQLKKAKLLVCGKTAEALGRMGIDPSKFARR